MFKWFAGLTTVGIGLVVATALSGAVPETAAKKGDRLDRLAVSPVSLTCSNFEWPYGCQWDAPKNRRAERPAQTTKNHRSFRSRAALAAKARRIALARATAGQVATR
jgi:hypothetical protein